MTPQMQTLLDKFQGNAYPAMIGDLAGHLGVAPESVQRLAPGWAPIVNFKKGPNFGGWWVIPGRDECGTVIGLGLRGQDDSKFMYPGSKLGLIYEVNPEHTNGDRGFTPGPHNWLRTMDAGVLCPVCGKPDGCLVTRDQPEDPKAALCARVKSTVQRGNGWLHVRKAEGDLRGRSILRDSELPVLVVEGFSDTCVALDMGFIGVGRPSDQTGMSILVSLLRGRKVVVVGENDRKADGREPGRLGMIAAFQNLSRSTPDVQMLMPPSHVKDLREWRKKDGLTKDDFLAYLKLHGQARDADATILDDRPTTIALSFLDSEYRQTGRYLLRQWEGNWYRYNDGKYDSLAKPDVIQPMYQWAKSALIVKEKANGDSAVVPLRMDNTMVNNLEQAVMAETLLPLAQLPCWVNGTQGPDPKDLIVFSNGIIDVKAYLGGDSEDRYLLPHTPDLFSVVALPFAFDPMASCPSWLKFLDSSLGDEPDKIQLLKEWMGYCMTSDTSMQKMMYFRGLAGSGKGTTLRVMHDLIGKGQGAATTFSDLAEPFGLKPLLGKLICTVPDARTPAGGKQLRGLEILLMMTGEDNVQVNRKNMQQIDDVRLIARVTVASNSFIEIPDHEGAMARRLLVIEWNRSFAANPDITLSERLHEERAGIALWALDGLRTLRANGRFTMPESMKNALFEWRTSNSPMNSFIEECCEASGSVAKARLFDVWAAWSAEHSVAGMSRSRFNERLRSVAPHIGHEETEGVAGRHISLYNGISLKKWAEKKY